jgi:hypothetical protein
MAGKPAEPRASQPPGSPGAQASEPAPSSTGAGAASAQERFGPLALTRMVKPDGRALIVYARADERS